MLFWSSVARLRSSAKAVFVNYPLVFHWQFVNEETVAVELGQSQPCNCISLKISFWSRTRGASNFYRHICFFLPKKCHRMADLSISLSNLFREKFRRQLIVVDIILYLLDNFGLWIRKFLHFSFGITNSKSKFPLQFNCLSNSLIIYFENVQNQFLYISIQTGLTKDMKKELN